MEMLNKILERENAMKGNTERVIKKLVGDRSFNKQEYLNGEISFIKSILKDLKSSKSPVGYGYSANLLNVKDNFYNKQLNYFKEMGFEFTEIQEKYEELLPEINKYLTFEAVN